MLNELLIYEGLNIASHSFFLFFFIININTFTLIEVKITIVNGLRQSDCT